MAHVIEGPNTFTVGEWHQSNAAKLARSELQRQHAKHCIAQTKQVISDRQEQTERGQRDVSEKLDQRIENVRFWYSELSRQLSALNAETDQLENYKGRLEAAVKGCAKPLSAAQQCLQAREGRINIDLVYDEVQQSLLTEVQVVNGVNAMLARALEQAVEQIRLNRSSAYHLKSDLKDKDITLNVDSTALSKNNLNIDEQLSKLCKSRQHSVVPRIQKSWTTPGDWQAYSQQGIAKAEEELQHSIRLRAAIDEILAAANEDLCKEKCSTDNALRQRIEDMSLAKFNLENSRAAVGQQIDEVCAQIDETQQAIACKQQPRSVAQERTRSRAQERPAPIELCKDAVQYRLHNELDDIDASVQELSQKWDELNVQLRALRRAQLDLEEDIAVKKNSLDIDNACVTIRNYTLSNY